MTQLQNELLGMLDKLKGKHSQPFEMIRVGLDSMSDESKKVFVEFLINEIQIALGFASETFKYHKEGRDEMVTENFKKYLSLYGYTEEDLEKL